jgi:large subunit ribosomal protein L13
MKKYYSHSGRPGGMKIKTFEQLRSYMPERIIEKAVKGMLPKGSLGKDLYRKLKVYSTDEHPHTAQQPILIL